jgi:hypothetical protein
MLAPWLQVAKSHLSFRQLIEHICMSYIELTSLSEFRPRIFCAQS